MRALASARCENWVTSGLPVPDADAVVAEKSAESKPAVCIGETAGRAKPDGADQLVQIAKRALRAKTSRSNPALSVSACHSRIAPSRSRDDG